MYSHGCIESWGKVLFACWSSEPLINVIQVVKRKVRITYLNSRCTNKSQLVAVVRYMSIGVVGVIILGWWERFNHRLCSQIDHMREASKMNILRAFQNINRSKNTPYPTILPIKWLTCVLRNEPTKLPHHRLIVRCIVRHHPSDLTWFSTRLWLNTKIMKELTLSTISIHSIILKRACLRCTPWWEWFMHVKPMIAAWSSHLDDVTSIQWAVAAKYVSMLLACHALQIKETFPWLEGAWKW